MVFPLPDCPLFSRSMPCRGIAYQPRVPTLGTHPAKQPRVLKERRIASVSLRVSPCLGHRPRPAYAVFLQNTPILSDVATITR